MTPFTKDLLGKGQPHAMKSLEPDKCVMLHSSHVITKEQHQYISTLVTRESRCEAMFEILLTRPDDILNDLATCLIRVNCCEAADVITRVLG